jgi:hypothetical protein
MESANSGAILVMNSSPGRVAGFSPAFCWITFLAPKFPEDSDSNLPLIKPAGKSAISLSAFGGCTSKAVSLLW